MTTGDNGIWLRQPATFLRWRPDRSLGDCHDRQNRDDPTFFMDTFVSAWTSAASPDWLRHGAFFVLLQRTRGGSLVQRDSDSESFARLARADGHCPVVLSHGARFPCSSCVAMLRPPAIQPNTQSITRCIGEVELGAEVALGGLDVLVA